MPLSSGCILLYTRVYRELVWVMAIFCTSSLVAANMTPFAMTYQTGYRQLNGCVNHRVYAQKQLQLFLGSYFCQLDISPFTADQDASKLAVLVCSPFDCSCASTRSHPLPLGKFLAVVCSRYFSLAACFVSLLSVLLRLSCALIRRRFVSFLPGSAASLLYTVRPDSELVRFAGAVLSLLGH